MGTIASQITSLPSVYSTVYSGADQSKHQSSASLAFVWGIHRGPVNSPHKGPVTRKMFPFDDVIMYNIRYTNIDQISFLRCFCSRRHRNHRALQNATCSLRALALWDRKWRVSTNGIVPWWWVVPESEECHALCWQSGSLAYIVGKKTVLVITILVI